MNLSHLSRRCALASLLVVAAACNSAPRATAPPVALVEQSSRPEAVSAAPPLVLEDGMRADLYYLASDGLQGRGILTPGLDLAADYIATRFQSLGLKPLPGLNGYFQPFEMTTAQSIDPATNLTVGDKTLKLEADYIALSFSSEKEFAGPVVFVGYGITDKGRNYDDYEGLDVKGKVVLAMRFEPHNAEGKSRWSKEEFTPNAHLETEAKVAAEHGAVALLLVNPPTHPNMANDPLLGFAKQPTGLVSLPILHVKQAVADAVLKGAGQPSLKELQAKIDADAKPASVPLKDVTAKGKVAIKRTSKTVKNVVAYLPGSGPTADEYVIIGSHYDHLGLGERGTLMNNPIAKLHAAATQLLNPTTGVTTAPVANPHATTAPASRPTTQAVHHGADDNASGTTTMLELARIEARLAKATPPRRSLIFIAFTAEESGLIGSNRFVNKPPIDLKKVAAMLNLDMVGRIRNHELNVGGGGTAEPLKAILKRADDESPLQFKNMGDGGLGPSDHMSFALKKVPVLFFFSGMHADYHRPTDTADKVNYDDMAEVARMSVGLIDDLERMPLSKYVDAADKHSMANPMSMGTGDPSAKRSASLGVIPHYGEDEKGDGVLIDGTSEGTAADKAGLQAGDIVLSLNDKPTTTLMELSAVLATQKPGDKVKLVYQRAGKRITTEVTLGARPG